LRVGQQPHFDRIPVLCGDGRHALSIGAGLIHGSHGAGLASQEGRSQSRAARLMEKACYLLPTEALAIPQLIIANGGAEVGRMAADFPDYK